MLHIEASNKSTINLESLKKKVDVYSVNDLNLAATEYNTFMFERVLDQARRCTLTNIPTQSSYPWNDFGVWKPGMVMATKHRDQLIRLLKPLRSKQQMWFEMQYANFKPRNAMLGQPVLDKVSNIDFYLTCENVDVEKVKIILMSYGIGGKKFSHDPDRIWNIKPPKAQSAIGITVGPEGDIYMGKKDEFWALFQEAAYTLIVDPPFEWDYEMISDMSHGRFMAKFYNWIYALALRTDSNPSKPRLIWIGSSIMYILERYVFDIIRDCLKDILSVAYTTHSTKSLMLEQGPMRRILFDYSEYDLRLRRQLIASVYQALQELYDLPVSLTVLCCAYAMFSPLLAETHEGLKLSFKDGIQPSGIGVFSAINTIVNLVVQTFTKIHFDEDPFQRGQAFGDNSWCPTSVRVDEWQDYVSGRFGMQLKESETAVSSEMTVMGRRFFTFDQEGGITIEPIVLSRARNALFPRVSNPNELSRYEVAVSYRAQFLDILHSHRYHGRYAQLIEYWLREITPFQRLLPDLSDRELASRLPSYANYDSLTYVKRALGIKETADLLTEL